MFLAILFFPITMIVGIVMAFQVFYKAVASNICQKEIYTYSTVFSRTYAI